MRNNLVELVRTTCVAVIVCASSLIFSSPPVFADDEAELAKKLANPVADLISVPFQYNWDQNLGADNQGSKQYVNIQPVIPFSISKDYNIISRTILPVISTDDLPAGNSSSGIGDVLQSFFFSPKDPTECGLIWGVGPALLFPTASEDDLGGEKWGAGPTFVLLKQEGPWTYGALSNHIWSYAGDSDRGDVNSTYIQPFMAFITETKTTISLNTESTYDWEDSSWSVPVNLLVNQLLKIGDQIVQIGAGPRYWVDSPDGGAEGWGVRGNIILLFPE